MATPSPDVAARFHELHHGSTPLLMPNAYDAGSARLLAHLGFQAVATTSSGFAGTLGRRDGHVTGDEAVAHGAALAAVVDVPVSADLEDGYGESPEDVAATITAAVAAGLAGASVEDHTRRPDAPVYERSLAVARVSAAAEAAHAGPVHLVLTARAENLLYGQGDLADTIERLQAYQEAGADVLYAPGLQDPDDIATVVRAVDRPVNVLVRPGGPAVAELGELGVARISVGGALSWVAAAAVADAARELLDAGTTGFLARSAEGIAVARPAYG